MTPDTSGAHRLQPSRADGPVVKRRRQEGNHRLSCLFFDDGAPAPLWNRPPLFQRSARSIGLTDCFVTLIERDLYWVKLIRGRRPWIPQGAYDELIRRSRQQSLLGPRTGASSWDKQTYMPSGGAAHRGGQMALLAKLHHDWATNPRVGELLAIVDGSRWAADVDSVAAVNIRAAPELRPPGPAAAGLG
jgi:hypothetical protein